MLALFRYFEPPVFIGALFVVTGTRADLNEQEASEKAITLHEDEPEMVARMLLCLYTSTYPATSTGRSSLDAPSLEEFMKMGSSASPSSKHKFEKSSLLVHSKMYALAEKYDLPGLRDISVKGFVFIPGYGRKMIDKSLTDFFPVLDHIHTSTPPCRTGLRRKASAVIQDCYKDIMRNAKVKETT